MASGQHISHYTTAKLSVHVWNHDLIWWQNKIDIQKHFRKTTITSSWTLSKTKIPITIVKAQMPSNTNQKSRTRDNNPGQKRHVPLMFSWWHINGTWAPSQYPKRRLSVRSRKVSKPRDLYLELSDRSEIWQALRQHCCRCACQISNRYDNLKYQSRGFEPLRDLTERRLFGYWDGALDAWLGPWRCVKSHYSPTCHISSLHVFMACRINVIIWPAPIKNLKPPSND